MGEDDSGRAPSSLPPQRLPASSCGGPVRQAFFSVRRHIQGEFACPIWSRIDLESVRLTFRISCQPHPLLPESPSPFQHRCCHSGPLNHRNTMPTLAYLGAMLSGDSVTTNVHLCQNSCKTLLTLFPSPCPCSLPTVADTTCPMWQCLLLPFLSRHFRPWIVTRLTIL